MAPSASTQGTKGTVRYPAGVPFPILNFDDPAVYFHLDVATKVGGKRQRVLGTEKFRIRNSA
jgi:hypothetical protein